MDYINYKESAREKGGDYIPIFILSSLCRLKFYYWRHRLTWFRTSGSQPEDQGSNPCGANWEEKNGI